MLRERLGSRFALALMLSGGLLLGACGKRSEPVTPHAPVALELNLIAPEYAPLRSALGMVRITEPRTTSDRLGYGGVLVVRGLTGSDYFAYELACPVESPEVVRLELQELSVVCPRCGSSYEVLHGSGAPLSGRARHPLRRYRTLYSPTTHSLRISNL